jgi:signal transduction histidine kinase/CheY-like chemotaxis protein
LGGEVLKFLAAILCALFFCAPSQAQAVDLPYEHLPATVGSSIEDAIASSSWVSGEGSANFGFEAKARWLRYTLPASDEIRIFSIDNPWLTYIDVYLVDDKTVEAKYLTGNARPQSSSPIANSGFAFGLTPQVTHIYVFDYGKSSSYFPVQLLNTAEYSSFSTNLNAFHGFYYGILLIMVLYNIATFFGTRDSAYLFYSLYASTLMIFLSTADGTGSLFLWPEAPWVQFIIFPMSWALLSLSLMEFAIRFLALQLSPHVKTAIRCLQGTFVLAALGTAIAPHPSLYILQIIISIFSVGALLYTGVYATLTKMKNGRTFLAANGVFAIGVLSHISMLLGWVEPSLNLQHAIHLGSIAELILLTFGLIRRLRASDEARYAAFQQSQQLSRRNKELSTAKALAEEHRQLQKSLQQAQKLKTIGQLAGGFAHDFNNILASILGFAELARDKSSLSDRATLIRYLEEIQKSGERGANLVKQLLVYSRSTASEPEELILGDALKQAHELLRGSLPATVSITTHIPDQTVRLYLDPEQLQQVLVNLCINAAESMNNRGQIDIRLEIENPQNLSCTSCLSRFSGEYIAIKVEDSGAGISGNAEQLFTPFHTSKEVGQGTGLGLSVVHGIVHEHGGHVHAANRAAGGARFVVYLPPRPVAAQVKESGKRILLIEDDASVALYLESLLDDDTFQTTFASMPTEALETFVADPDAFDLVITDYLMPQGTGLELAEDIHALRPDLPVILTTGNANNLDSNALARAGLAGIFEKPLNSEQLLAKIRGLLAK